MRLRIHFEPVDEEHHHLFVRRVTGVNGAMSARLRILPLRLTGADGHAEVVCGVTELDRQLLAAHYYGETPTAIHVPRRRLTGLEHEPADQQIVPAIYELYLHGRIV